MSVKKQKKTNLWSWFTTSHIVPKTLSEAQFFYRQQDVWSHLKVSVITELPKQLKKWCESVVSVLTFDWVVWSLGSFVSSFGWSFCWQVSTPQFTSFLQTIMECFTTAQESTSKEIVSPKVQKIERLRKFESSKDRKRNCKLEISRDIISWQFLV